MDWNVKLHRPKQLHSPGDRCSHWKQENSPHGEHSPSLQLHLPTSQSTPRLVIACCRQTAPPKLYQRPSSNDLDEVLDAVKATLPSTVPTIEDDVRNLLLSIESAITGSNFVCSIPAFLVGSFAQGLALRPLRMDVLYSVENQFRRAHALAHSGELFSHVDCDLGSLIYLSIAEAFGLPIRMVEVPQHNFVRWHFSETSYLNWDTNYGFDRYSDAEYAVRHGVSPEHISSSIYLASLSTTNVDGYFDFCRGLTYEAAKNFAPSVATYRQAISRYPQSPSARNNLAWLYASVNKVQALIPAGDALKFALEACELHRKHNFLDTLACVYAELGDFHNAIAIEQEAYNQSHSPGYAQMVEAFKAGRTWMDIHGSED